MRRGTVLALLVLLGCPPSVHRVGLGMVEQGRYHDAVDYWLRMADEDPDQRRALADAGLYAQEAFRELQDVAREHEAQGRLEESLATYRKLEGFLDRLRAHDLASFPTDTVATERAAVETALARKHRDQGVVALEAGRFEDAVASFEAALALREGFHDVEPKLAETLRRWGAAELSAHRYREAIAHYDRAYAVGGDPVDRGWAAQIHIAYGRDYLRKGACRRAVTELRAGEGAVSDPRLAPDLAEALACARTDLVVLPFEDVSAAKAAGTALGAMFRDELEAALRAGATEFLRLLDPGSPAGRRLEDPANLEGDPARFLLVRGRITQIQVERPEPRPFEQAATGRIRVLCDDEGAYDTGGDTWCEEDVPLLAVGDEKGAFVRIAATVRAISARTGEQLLTAPLQHREETDRSHVRSFLRASDRAEVRVGPTPDVTVIAVDPVLLAKMEQPAALPPDSQLVADAIRAGAEQAAAALLLAIDGDEEVKEPARLVIDPPVTDASMIRFEEAAPAPDAPAPDEPAP